VSRRLAIRAGLVFAFAQSTWCEPSAETLGRGAEITSRPRATDQACRGPRSDHPASRSAIVSTDQYSIDVIQAPVHAAARKGMRRRTRVTLLANKQPRDVDR